MWHRLPLEDKRRPAGYAPRVERRRAPAGMDRGSRRAASRSGVDRDDVAFGWDNEFPRHDAEVDAFSIERFNVTNAQFLEFVEAGGYGDARWWRPEDWKWIQSERVSHPLFWERGRRDRAEGGRRNGRVVLARHVRTRSAAARVAGVRQPCGGRGVCAVARRAPHDRSRVPARGIRGPVRARPMANGDTRGETRPVGRARRIRFFELGSRACRQSSRGTKRLGRRRSRRQRLGMDQHALCTVSGVSGRWRRIRSILRTSSMASTW